VRQGHCELLNEFLPEPGLLTQQNQRLDQNFALFLTVFDKIPTNQPPKKSTTKALTAHNKCRRKHIAKPTEQQRGESERIKTVLTKA
jgi:hypothetical protein